jgi:hypothetical protein
MTGTTRDSGEEDEGKYTITRMTPRRNQPAETPPDLPTEKAYQFLKGQLAKLDAVKGRDYRETEALEDEWFGLTSKLVLRSFGSGSNNYSDFRRARSAGEYYMSPFDEGINHAQNQRNFEARLVAYESALRSSISELELDLPQAEIKGVYEPGEQYEFYRDITACLRLASKEIFVVDPYLSVDIFDVYASAIPRKVSFRLLSANVPAEVRNLAQKYAAGGNLAFRSSASIHDRVLFADNRVWVCGQSLKDAANRKPTYIVEHDEPLMRPVYEQIWNTASSVL